MEIVTDVVLYLADPAAPYFDPSVWLDEQQLIALARAAWGWRCTSALPAGPGMQEFLITYDSESGEFDPVLQLSFGSLVTQIHATTGVTVLARNLITHATECQ